MQRLMISKIRLSSLSCAVSFLWVKALCLLLFCSPYLAFLVRGELMLAWKKHDSSLNQQSEI